MIPLRSTERTDSTSIVVPSLILANFVIFIYELTMGPSQLNRFIMLHGIVPDRFHWSSLVTTMFIHGGWLHVIGNMWFLWVYGRNVEDEMGAGRFLAFYFLCGFAAGLVHLFFNPYSRIPTVGASGAIAGVMGAFLIKFPRARIITLVPLIIFLTTLEIPAAFLLLYWFAIQFFSGIGSVGYSQVSTGGVAWFAHIGGFVAGMLLVNLLARRRQYRGFDW